VSQPDHAEQYERLERELRAKGLLTRDEPPDDPALDASYGCWTVLMWYAIGGLLGAALLGVAMGVLERHAVAMGVGGVALVACLLIGRPALRRSRATFAATQRLEEWSARQPGGRGRLRARYRRAAVTAAVGCTLLFLSRVAVSPLQGVLSLALFAAVLLAFAPHIRRQTRWYRQLTAEPGSARTRPRRRHRRRGRGGP
jgi:hypothetical protein